MVITKDLSRLGRDYIKTGYYLENYFPEHGVRYVAITDGIDTFLDSSTNDITPFKAIMNDMYAKDISKKIRSVVKEKQKKGEYMCTFAPYGYKKDPNQKNHLIIDENVKDTVIEIFDLYSKGKGTKYIAEYLNKKNIPSPMTYLKNLSTPKKWNDVTILNMIKSETYIGNTVSNKKPKLSYKSKKRILTKKEQYLIIPNTHEPIIDNETYEKVQFYLSNRDMNKKTKHEFLFRGLLECHTCHCKLSIGSKTSENPIPYITCSQSRKGKCPSQHMNYKKFENQLLQYLQYFLKIYVQKDWLAEVYDKFKTDTETIIDKYKKEITSINNKINTVSEQIDNIYFDKLNKVISEADYFRYTNKILVEKNILEKRKEELSNNINNILEAEKKREDDNELDNIINEFLSMKNISKSMLFRLIDKIEIDENKNVYVYFAFSKLNILNELTNDVISLKEICKRDIDTYHRKN